MEPLLASEREKGVLDVPQIPASIHCESDEPMRPTWEDDCAIACSASTMRLGKGMQFFGARVNLPRTLLYDIS